MSYQILNTTCLFPKVIDDLILSYIPHVTKPQWKSKFKQSISLINEFSNDDDIMMWCCNKRVPPHWVYYQINRYW